MWAYIDQLQRIVDQMIVQMQYTQQPVENSSRSRFNQSIVWPGNRISKHTGAGKTLLIIMQRSASKLTYCILRS